ncbi:MAG: helicase-related protein [Myxococcota bacterium]
MAYRPPEQRISAILGPTNTGKTHQAIERMLAHPTGMIGLPLRLLAREVYDKVVARRGVDAVALVTGEEKRIPADPQFFVCTVEAMPVDRRVAFLAVDEVQLAGDRNRGHTFTDRLLHARGTEQTVFLGAATIANVLEGLVPGVQIETAPRLSKLTWAGPKKLASIPPRSAVVTFSAEAVYETAERLRAVHGGTAVVLGALSPRTRNAQVAMYQAGEVKHLVATDAIGMGLNMDIHHVAFGGIRKFDGRNHRELTASELAQIAGRAGRYRTDGTFGTIKEVGELRPDLIEAIEGHEFPPLTQLIWRNSDLDWSSPEDLLQSLRRPPPSRLLVPSSTEDDEQALERLSATPEIRAKLTSTRALALLWEVCQVPDYRKTHTDAHLELLGQIAQHLLDRGELPDAFVDGHVRRLHRTDGDIETLMARISWIRTWTYVAWRGWTRSEAGLRDRTRRIEDELSDALHERLTARFVDRRTLVVLGPAAADAPLAIEDGVVTVGGIPVGRMRDASFEPTGQGGEAPASKSVQAAVRRRLRAELLPVVDDLVAATDDAILLGPDGRLSFGSLVLARATAGPTVLEPKITLGRLDLLDPPDRERIRVRLQRWREAVVAELFAPLDRPAATKLGPAGRGLVHTLRGALGTIDREEVEDLVSSLRPDDRGLLAKLDVRIGTFTVYVQSLLRQQPMAVRAALWSIARGRFPMLEPPGDGRPTFRPTGAGRDGWRALGYRVIGGLAIRADQREKVGAEVRAMARTSEPRSVDVLTSWLGCTADEALAVVRALGFQIRSEPEGRIRLRRAR